MPASSASGSSKTRRMCAWPIRPGNGDACRCGHYPLSGEFEVGSAIAALDNRGSLRFRLFEQTREALQGERLALSAKAGDDVGRGEQDIGVPESLALMHV
jgi:hypothetical protein